MERMTGVAIIEPSEGMHNSDDGVAGSMFSKAVREVFANVRRSYASAGPEEIQAREPLILSTECSSARHPDYWKHQQPIRH
jgi:hypothetical protein